MGRWSCPSYQAVYKFWSFKNDLCHLIPNWWDGLGAWVNWQMAEEGPLGDICLENSAQVNNFVDFHCSAGLLLGHLHGGAKPSDWRSISGNTWHFLMIICEKISIARSQTPRCHQISTLGVVWSSVLLFCCFHISDLFGVCPCAISNKVTTRRRRDRWVSL